MDDAGVPVTEPISELDPVALAELAERMLLGGPRRYTRAGVTQRSGVPPEFAQRLWRALGFATVDNDDVVFTEADVEVLRKLSFLAEHGLDDEDTIASITRMLGRTFSRLAAWQGQLLLELVAERPELLQDESDLIRFVFELVPALQDVQAYVWRRQLAAYFARVASHTAVDGGAAAPHAVPAVVGFADLQGFTALTRRSSETQLRILLDSFETLATDVVGGQGGRIVKAIGDEVLFVAEDPASGAEIGLGLQEAAADVPDLPGLRIGIAAGPVVQRLGDVYGSTVNIASRLTSLCRPGWVLVDRVMSDALADDPRFELRSRRSEAVRGFGHLHQWRLRRARPSRADAGSGSARRK
jgi:adenylate cyclase